MLRRKLAELVTKVAQKCKFTPVLKLENSAYTRDEWLVILKHSQIRSLEAGLFLTSDHLSQTRLKESLLQGLEESGSADLRADIWKLLCRVELSKKSYERGVYRNLLM
jgi:hypothetical protein